MRRMQTRCTHLGWLSGRGYATPRNVVFVHTSPESDTLYTTRIPSSLYKLDSPISITDLSSPSANMASVLNYFIDSLDDFVFLAQYSPLRATLSALLIASLAFRNVWASWIARLQQSQSLNVTSTHDAIPEANGVNGPPRSASTIRPSGWIGNDDTRPNRGRASFSSAASTVSNRRYNHLPGPIGFPISSPELSDFLNPRGPVVVSPPLDGRGGVSFYPSTSPSYRGKSVQLEFWPIFGT